MMIWGSVGMKFVRTVGAAALVSVWAMSTSPLAFAGGKDWWLNVSAGLSFDDRVTVDDVDASAASDVAAEFTLDAGYKILDDDQSRIEIGYDFSQTVYSDLSAFNYQEHAPSLNMWTKSLGGVKLGLNYTFYHSLLDGDFFEDQHVVAPSLSAYLADDVQLTLTYRYYDKNYNPLDDARDAKTQQPSADLYYYFEKSKKGYLMVGAGYTNEDTKGDEFDYSGFLGRATVQVPVDPFGLPGRLKVSYSYQMRDYDNAISLAPLPNTATRQDDRQMVRVYADAEIATDLKLFADYHFSDRGSNLASADYNKNDVYVGLEYSF